MYENERRNKIDGNLYAFSAVKEIYLKTKKKKKRTETNYHI